MKTLNDAKRWVKAHKKPLLIGGAAVGAVAVVALGVRGAGVPLANLREVPSAIEPAIIPVTEPKTVQVAGHIRNLPSGWKPSADKITQAKQIGVSLAEHQTIVNPYSKLIT